MLDFIERYLGISPDHGDGTLESLIIILAFMTIATLASWLPGYRRR
jgi:hypothetical protein